MNREEKALNINAHKGLDRLDFAHTLINQMVFHEALRCRKGLTLEAQRPPKTIDIGCGTGYLLKKFLGTGWDASGLDPFPRGESLKAPLRKRVIQGTIDSVASNRFDLVTAVEVIEHSTDYLSLLKEIRRILRHNGRLIITVPNSWPFHEVIAADGRTVPKYGHLWKFDADGLRRDLEVFFVDVGVKPIYSRWLEQRLLRISQYLPFSLIRKISGLMVRYKHNGAWLLGWGTHQEGLPASLESPPRPSATHYLKRHPSLRCEPPSSEL